MNLDCKIMRGREEQKQQRQKQYNNNNKRISIHSIQSDNDSYSKSSGNSRRSSCSSSYNHHHHHTRSRSLDDGPKKSNRRRRRRSRSRRDNDDDNDDDDTNRDYHRNDSLKRRSLSPQGRRASSRQLIKYDHNDHQQQQRKQRRSNRNRNRYYNYRGDASTSSGNSGDMSVRSYSTTGSSSRSHHRSSVVVRHDVDDEGYCVHHPEIQLMRHDNDNDNHRHQRSGSGGKRVWRTIRKKCPECIIEDCPSMMGGMINHNHASASTTSMKNNDNNNNDRRKQWLRQYYNNNNNNSSSNTGAGDVSTSTSAYSSSHHYHQYNNNNASISNMSSSVSHSIGLLTGRLSFTTPEAMEEEEATNRLKRRLAARAYHFPGNTWVEDWIQYLSNTHTVLGLFFHHPLHPMGFQERLVILFGSIAIGLTISNFTYLYFIRNDIDVDEEVFNINSRHTDYTGIPVVSITKLMITLWTLGSFIHTVFDLGLWHMKACTLCRYVNGRLDDQLVRWGRVVGLFIVMIAMGAGGYAVLLRASIEYKGEGSVANEVEESIMSNELYQVEFEDKRSFRFLLGYLVEFVLALFVYYPIAVTILFSGILGCGGRVPVLGGRPREVKRERRYEMRKRQPKILKAINLPATAEEDDDCDSVYTSGSYRDDESRDRFNRDQII